MKWDPPKNNLFRGQPVARWKSRCSADTKTLLSVIDNNKQSNRRRTTREAVVCSCGVNHFPKANITRVVYDQRFNSRIVIFSVVVWVKYSPFVASENINHFSSSSFDAAPVKVTSSLSLGCGFGRRHWVRRAPGPIRRASTAAAAAAAWETVSRSLALLSTHLTTAKVITFKNDGNN